MRRTISMVGGLAMMTAIVSTASADTITGTVTHVHPASNIVKFNDGRTIYLEPGATFQVDGRQVSIDDIRPGTRVTVNGGRQGADEQGAAAQQPPMRQGTALLPSGHPPIDASGTVASFDAQTGVMTFQDGRMVKLGPRASVWEHAQTDAIRPGRHVVVRNAQPTGYVKAWDASDMPRHRMGTVTRVDPASATIVLGDGTIVRVSPATRMQSHGQSIMLSNLQPGDEVVIVGRQRAATSGESAGMASPGMSSAAGSGSSTRSQSLQPFTAATFDASDIHLIRRHQAP
jgi:preprotein translocase subunit YajC